ncbi:hypothetical protein F4802DRAFT_24499 [Xylaria palmicola]|nr:hypothetical protein F4802DRAFT_24499 [Xylaria palmicola]
MAPDVSCSSTSPDRLADDGSTDPDDYSSDSDDHVYISVSERPPLPLLLSTSAISKSLPSKLAEGIVSRGPGSSPRSHSAHPHLTYHEQRVSSSSQRPPPPPPFPPSNVTRAPPSDLSQSSDARLRRRGNRVEPPYARQDRSHGNNRDDFVASSGVSYAPERKANSDSDRLRRLTELYADLQDQRLLFLANLKKAQSQRARVLKSRQRKDEADEIFMASARALLSNGLQPHELHQLFKAMQNARQGGQEAEQHLEEVANELQSTQEALASLEGAFYETAIGALGTAISEMDKDWDSHPEQSEDPVLRGITGDRPETIHPLYEKLRAAFGELQLARELLANTQMKREALHARKTQPLTEDSLHLLETYGDAGRKKALELRAMSLMTEADIEQLQEYDGLEQSARQDIETYTETVRILQQECRENGVLPSSSSFQQEGFGLDSFYRDEIRLAPSPFDSSDESATLAHPVFPLLLSNPTHLLQGFPQTALQSLRRALQLPLNSPVRARQANEAAREANMHSLLSSSESEDKSEYINRWLLHKLHHSAMEAELLWTTFRSRLKILDIDRWQRDVLHFWWRDESVDPASVSVEDNDTDKASKFVGSRVAFNTLSHSDSGQLDNLRDWKLDDSWP